MIICVITRGLNESSFFFFRRVVEEKSDEAKSRQKSKEEISALDFLLLFLCDATRFSLFLAGKKQLKCPFCSFFWWC